MRQDFAFPPCKRICSVLLMTGGPLTTDQSPVPDPLTEALVMFTMVGREAKPLFCQVESVDGAG